MTTATKKATHTPGPWKWFYSEERKGIEEIAFYPPDGRKQAFAYASIASPEDTANARLIAAAPELLEALELAEMRIHDLVIRTRKQCEYVDSLDGEGATEELRRYIRLSETAEKDIKAAIRKARGTE